MYCCRSGLLKISAPLNCRTEAHYQAGNDELTNFDWDMAPHGGFLSQLHPEESDPFRYIDIINEVKDPWDVNMTPHVVSPGEDAGIVVSALMLRTHMDVKRGERMRVMSNRIANEQDVFP